MGDLVNFNQEWVASCVCFQPFPYVIWTWQRPSKIPVEAFSLLLRIFACFWSDMHCQLSSVHAFVESNSQRSCTARWKIWETCSHPTLLSLPSDLIVLQNFRALPMFSASVSPKSQTRQNLSCCRQEEEVCRTISLCTGMQSSTLAGLLATQFLGSTQAVPPACSVVVMAIMGLTLASFWGSGLKIRDLPRHIVPCFGSTVKASWCHVGK